jgi:hypothetical protein
MSQPPLRTGLTAFTAHGSTPVGRFVSGHCSPSSHWCTPGFTFGYLGYWESQPAVGLRHVVRLSRPRTTTPTPPLPRASAFRQASPLGYVPLAFHPVGSFPCSRSWTPATSGRWRLPDLPSALCGSPTCSRIGRLSASGLFPFTGAEGVRLLLRLWLQDTLAVLVSKVGQGTNSP